MIGTRDLREAGMLCELAAVVGLMALGDVGPNPLVGPAKFEGWFESARRGRLEIPPAVALKASTFRYVFVGGYRNEGMPGYFSQNIAELRALGVPRNAIHMIYPSSARTSEENAEEVRTRFRAVGGEGPEKLVVIAHSRGACDALGFAIANASFVRDRVEALFLIQGPFGGSGVAEYAIGRGSSMDRRMPWQHRILGHLAGRLARYNAGPEGTDVLEGMTRAASLTFWSKALAEHADAVATVGPRTFYVTSTIEPTRLRFVRRAVAWYLKVYHGPSDGMVAVADQYLPELGTVVATLEAGHGDLTHRFPATRASRWMRKALSRSIFMAVGQPEPALAVREPAPSPQAVDRVVPVESEPLPAKTAASQTVR